MRIHLGHHFYGAGNLGDDFMLGGFLLAMAKLAPDATFSGCVPFSLEPLRCRFPQIDWFEYTAEARTACIRAADVWLGLGGSPFQSAQSRWFIDHLLGDADRCRAARRPMFYLGVGVQYAEELKNAEVVRLCATARAIWTRDAASAEKLSLLQPQTAITAASDVSHILFLRHRPKAATRQRVAVVANSDYGEWPQLPALVDALESLQPAERLWIAQENRDLPGAERALFQTLPERTRTKWHLHAADAAARPLAEVVAAWPTPEWLLTSRYHAAIASAWGGAKSVIVGINEKLRSIARELDAPLISPSAPTADVAIALARATVATRLDLLAVAAETACREFVAAARAG